VDNKPIPTNILHTIEQEMDTDLHPLLKKILDNIKPIGVTVVTIIVLVAAYSGVSTYQSSQKNQASSELGTILILNDQATRMERLTTFAHSGHKDLRLVAYLELAKSYMDTGEYAQAANAWKEVALHHSPEVQTIAGLGEAKALIAQGEFAQAVEVLTKLKGKTGPGLTAIISSTLVFAAEKAGQKDVALAEYEALKAQGEGNSDFLNYKINQLKTKS